MVVLLYFLVWVVPDRFQGDPPLTGASLILSRVGVPTAILAMILTFPSLFLAGLFDHLLVPYQAVLVTLPVSAAMWAWIFIVIHRRCQRRKTVSRDC